MALQSTGKISLSDIQTLFGGTNPITMSEYYNNNASGFTTGVTGIPNSGATISISHFYGKAKPSASSLYGFTAHTFTNAGATGRTGPIISQVRSAYSTATWAQNSAYLNMTTQGIQEWTVPATGSYTIDVAGAGGGNPGQVPGNGARMIGTFNLTQGMVLAILVGQQGIAKNSSCNAGGGGGTFVWNKSSTSQPLIVGGGGGGGGGGCSTTGLSAPTTANGTGGFGTSTAGSNGNGATPGGSGWLTNGTVGLDSNNSGCQRPLEGGLGGAARADYSIGDGGFGGGASASGQSCGNGGPGGGGGYSGGAGPSGDTSCGSSGGGGSYNSGTNQTNTAGANAGNGYVTITPNSIIQAPTGGTGGTGGTGDLYTFSTHTFTNAGATGINGPILSQVQSSYSTATWAQNTSFLNMSIQGIQLWTVPTTGSYRIRTMGASAGRTPSFTGGRGVIIQADVALNKGDVIKILVGQGGTGKNDDCNTGAGGGTFVTFNDNTIILIAGGGGAFGNGIDAVTTRNGGSATNGSAGGTNGSGGVANQGPSGAGYSGNGAAAQWGSLGGVNNGIAQSFLNGGQGGSSVQQNPNVLGGFGGGASGHGNCCIGGGGGGGYSGGGGATSCTGGGGGGSFIITTATNVQTSTGTYDGSGSFNGSAITNLNVWNTYGTASSGVFAPSGSVTITKI